MKSLCSFFMPKQMFFFCVLSFLLLSSVRSFSSCYSCTYKYANPGGACYNCALDCDQKGYSYFCCESDNCCCYSSSEPCNSNPKCPCVCCGSPGPCYEEGLLGLLSVNNTQSKMNKNCRDTLALALTLTLTQVEGKEKVNCVPVGDKCSSTADCCVNLCSPTSCSNGICIGSYCKGRGSTCQADCECCSKDCFISETSPGFCN